MKWNTKKPNKACVFVCRTKYKDVWDYNLFQLEWVDFDGRYLAWLDSDGDELDDLTALVADEYLILERIKEIK